MTARPDAPATPHPADPAVAAPAVRIVLAGGPRLEAGGAVVADRGPGRHRAALTLAYLAFARGRRVPADELAEAIWPEGPPASWAASLRRLVSDVRGWLALAGLEDTVSSAQLAYRLDLPADVVVDVDEAAGIMALGSSARPEQVAAAAALTAAPLLPGFDAGWLEPRRREVRQLHLDALEQVAEHHHRAGRHQEAILAAREVVAADPLRESAYRLLMAAHRDSGRVGSALRAYEECRSRLAEDLGTAPSASTVAAYQGLLFPFAGEVEHGNPLVSGQPSVSVMEAALASATVATRTAIGNLEGRLAAVEANPHPDPIARVELLIELGQARWALSGATDQLRRISLAAGEAAIHLGSAEHFGAVTQLASTTTGVGEHDPDTEDLCERALVAFGHLPGTRSRILGLLSELRAGDQAVELAAESVDLARSVGQPGALLDALLVLDQALSWSPDLERRLAVEAECASLLHHSGRWRTRPTFEPLTRLQAGDLAWYRTEADRLADLARRGTQWEPGFYAVAFRAVLAHLAGDLDAATALADQLMAGSHEEINAVHSAAGLFLAITRDKGGVGEVLPVIEVLAEQSPAITAFGAAVALGRSAIGDHDGCVERLDAELGPALDDAPRDHIWPLALGLLAEAAALDGTPAHAARVLAELDPYGGQVCAGAHATVLLGTVDAFRGSLAWRVGDLPRADAHLVAALELEGRLGAPLFQARTHAWSAVVRRALGDGTAAADHAAAAERLAAPAAGTAESVARILALHL